MPKYSHGSDVQAWVRRVLSAILGYVNYEFEEEVKLSFDWREEHQLIVRTTLRVLVELTQKDDDKGNLDKRKVREALRYYLKDFLQILEDNRTQNQGAEDWHFTLKLWSSDKAENLRQFDQAWERKRGKKLQQPAVSPKQNGIHWREICHAMLEKRRRATSNILMQEESAKFEREQIYVPLALVERKKQDKRDREFLPEKGTQLYEPQYQETQRFEHDTFFSQILEKGEGKSQGKQIALIGEPGAGKTTLLHAIAFWLLEKNLGLPIWINLADLSGKDISKYLLEVWLNQAIPPTRLSQIIRDDLVKQIEQGRVWLLLDGVDEIVASTVKLNNARNWGDSSFHSVPLRMTSENPIQAMADQLTGWINQARVVLTCRLNVWLASTNALETFETYRLLDFDYPQQVHQFIDNWFNPLQPLFVRGEQDGSICLSVSQDTSISLPLNQDTSTSLPLSKGESEGVKKAERLKAELAQPERIRIRDLVQNPLRLALLCSTWQTWEGHLPDTQAGLYQKFVQQFYIWKASIFHTDRQDELNQALGQLALRDIDEGTSRFRLREGFIEQELGNITDKNSLFSLALQLGWLNVVGVAAEKPDEKVYAFYHPTFEEYFAALAVEDWHFFLNHRNPPLTLTDQEGESANALKALLLKGGWGDLSYRIFEPQWKQVILLWLGREDVEKEQKEEFIQALVEFEDGCGGFYWYRAYFITAAGIAEFKDCSWADEIVETMITLGFGCFNTKKQKWRRFLDPVEEGARAVLLQTECPRAIAALVELIHTAQEASTRWQAAESLEKIGKDNPEAIAALVKLIHSSKHEFIRLQAAESLGEIDKDNHQAIAALVKLIHSSKHEFIRLQAAESLGKIDKDNPQAIATLVELIHFSQDEDSHGQAVESLGEIGKDNPEAIAALVKLIHSSQDEYIRRQAVESLGEIGKDNPEAIDALVKLIHSSQDEYIRRQTVESLGEIDKDNPEAIAALVKLINSSQDEYTRRQAAQSLGEIGKDNLHAIAALVQLINSSQDEYTRRQAAQSLGKISKDNPHSIAALVKLIHSSHDESTRLQAAESLGKIDKDNPQAIAALVRLIHTSQDKYTPRQAANSLGEIGKDNPHAIAALVKLIHSSHDESTRLQAAESLG
ncbi:HEAT repeat domain-containing protein, partial [Coleofasciculus sp.]|uniref:HEAT repeat domain-containing protein n=1 Tax=Coleofasciculus sp. TaxID=3100458 RepID=UPI0039FB83D8